MPAAVLFTSLGLLEGVKESNASTVTENVGGGPYAWVTGSSGAADSSEELKSI